MSHEDPKGPIFIGGAARSGTTLMRVMLDAHRHICCGPEMKLMANLADLYQQLAAGWLTRIMESYHNTPDDVRSCFRGLISGLMANSCKAVGKLRWAEKTPNNVMQMLALGDLFPEARFIHILRDGRDVACSLIRMEWVEGTTREKVDYTQSISNAAQYWNKVVRWAREQMMHPSLAGRVIEVRYESLVADPEGNMREVLRMLEEPWDPAVLLPHLKDRTEEARESSTDAVSEPIYTKAVGRWQTEMTPRDKAAFKVEAGVLLTELGYAQSDYW